MGFSAAPTESFDVIVVVGQQWPLLGQGIIE
jgi:hypothetical protein